MNVGFIGLGVMGRPMAGHLRAAGHELYVYTLGEMPSDLVASGAIACTSATDVAKQADVVITMVPDTPGRRCRALRRARSRGWTFRR